MRISWIFLFLLFCYFSYFFSLNVCENNTAFNLNVSPPPSSPCHPFVRFELWPLVKNLHFNVNSVLKFFFLSITLGVIFYSSLDISLYKYRFISLNTRLNILPKIANSSSTTYRDLNLLLLVLSYITIFEYYLIIFLPCEFFKVQLHIKARLKQPCRLMKIFHCCVLNITNSVCNRITYLIYINLAYSLYYPHEVFALWYILLRLTLSLDIHPNPGPGQSNNNFSRGFLSFCNWNLNTLSKDDFYRISLLEAHNTIYNYDIISLCETSLNDSVQVAENVLPGYKFHACNHPDGDRSGGVGIFYKETLPLRIRQDLSFDECIVSEMIFGHRKIFFTVLYRNPHSKAQSAEFNYFLENLENLYLKIKNEKPYAMFFTGDFNGHSQSWYPEGDTNAEGVLLDNLFSDLNLTQIISEPTHFMRDDCKPSCIDLIVTDQPNIVLDSGVRPSLDPTVKHQIIFCKINFKIPPLPKYVRKIWHFN